MRALLRIFFDDVRKEEWTPSYAGGSSRIDFVLPECGLAVELKHARASMTSAGLGAELIVDIDRYKENQHVEHLLCMVFDHDGYIDNPRGIEGDLTTNRGSNDFPVTVIVIDR